MLEGGAEAGIEVGIRDTAGVGVWVFLSLVRAPPASLFLPPGGGLWQMLWQARGLAIVLMEK